MPSFITLILIFLAYFGREKFLSNGLPDGIIGPYFVKADTFTAVIFVLDMLI